MHYKRNHGNKIIFKIFFLTSSWFLRDCLLFKKVFINNQILDHQTQAFLALQSLQIDNLDDAMFLILFRELREKLIEGLPLSAKPCMPVKLIDHSLSTEFGAFKSGSIVQIKAPSMSPILYFHGGGYVFGGIESHDAWLQFFSAEIGAKYSRLIIRLAPENKFPSCTARCKSCN